MSLKRAADELPPAMSTRSKRVKLNAPTPQPINKSLKRAEDEHKPAMSTQQRRAKSNAPAPQPIKSLKRTSDEITPATGTLSKRMKKDASASQSIQMPSKRAADELTPVMSAPSKRMKTSTSTPQRPKIVEPEEIEDSESLQSEATSISRRLSSITSVEQSPTSTPPKALTPPPTPMRKPGRKRGQKAFSQLSKKTKAARSFSLKTATEVSEFWYTECSKIFTLEDGFEIDVYDYNQDSQQVIVWESELHDESLLQQPGPELSKEQLKDPALDGRARTEADCDFSHNVKNPPETLKQYERIKSNLKERDVPVLVIECRAASADSDFEWRNPRPQNISRSYTSQPCSDIQAALMKYIYTFNDRIRYEPKGWMTQEQCFCATAIGDKVKFWKHVNPYPHLKPWSAGDDVLSLSKDERAFKRVMGERLAEAKEDGYEFAMEMYGRETFAQ
jgi:hypothetical protein